MFNRFGARGQYDLGELIDIQYRIRRRVFNTYVKKHLYEVDMSWLT